MNSQTAEPAPLSAQMQLLAERMARVGNPPLYTLPAAEARALNARAAGVLEISPPRMARIDELRIPTRDGAAIGARHYAPSAGVALPALLYFHGGGFTFGSTDTHDVVCRSLAQASGAAVVAVNYRLAPEHRFPVAVDDCWDALDWLVNQAPAQLPIDGQRLAVGGDSAGGTLAAVAAIHARDRGLQLALQLLIYPGTAACQDTPSHRIYAAAPVLPKPQIDWFFNNYIAPGARTDWRFAPLLAPDVDGVAPAWLGLAECDPLVDEGLLYGDKLRAAGVAVELEIYRGVVHGFVQMSRALPEARRLFADAGAALRAAFAGS